MHITSKATKYVYTLARISHRISADFLPSTLPFKLTLNFGLGMPLQSAVTEEQGTLRLEIHGYVGYYSL